MHKFGAIVLVPFPFTDLTSAKVRPALVLSRKESEHGDLILCFITSQNMSDVLHTIALPADKDTCLKVQSLARLDKIATLDQRVILGEIGHVTPAFLRKYSKSFQSIFGF